MATDMSLGPCALPAKSTCAQLMSVYKYSIFLFFSVERGLSNIVNYLFLCIIDEAVRFLGF